MLNLCFSPSNNRAARNVAAEADAIMVKHASITEGVAAMTLTEVNGENSENQQENSNSAQGEPKHNQASIVDDKENETSSQATPVIANKEQAAQAEQAPESEQAPAASVPTQAASALVVTTTTTNNIMTETEGSESVKGCESKETETMAAAAAAATHRMRTDAEGAQAVKGCESKETETMAAAAAAASAATVLTIETTPAPAAPKPTMPPIDMGLDYDTSATALYKAVESKAWNKVMDLCDNDATKEVTAKEAAQYLHRKDNSKKSTDPNAPLKIRWRLLPLHASLIFKAPSFVVSKLLEVYPAAIYLKDDRGMTPVHLAFRHSAPDEVLFELLEVAEAQMDLSRVAVEAEEAAAAAAAAAAAEPKEGEAAVVAPVAPTVTTTATVPAAKLLPCILDTTDRRGRKPLDLHRAVMGVKSMPMSPKKGQGSGTSASGMSKYVAIMTHDIKTSLEKEISEEYDTTSATLTSEKNALLEQTKETYEKTLTDLRAELEATLANLKSTDTSFGAEHSVKLKEITKDLRTAQLGSESLIHRYDLKVKNIDQFHLEVMHAQERLMELCSGNEGVLGEKARMVNDLEAFKRTLEDAKTGVQRESDELDQTSATLEAWTIEQAEAQVKLESSTAEQARFTTENAALTENLELLTKQAIDLVEQLVHLTTEEQGKTDTLSNLEASIVTLKETHTNESAALERTNGELTEIDAKLEELKLVESIKENVTTRLAKVQAQYEATSAELEAVDLEQWGDEVVQLTEEAVQLEVERDLLLEEHETSLGELTKMQVEAENASSASAALMTQFKTKVETEAQLQKKVKVLQVKHDELKDPKHEAENIALKHHQETLSQHQVELQARKQSLEEELYHKKTQLFKLEELQKNSMDLSMQDQVNQAEVMRQKDKAKLLERLVKELQHRMEQRQEEHRVLETEYRQKGYHLQKAQLERLMDTRQAEEKRTRDMSMKVDHLSNENEHLRHTLEEASHMQELDLVKLKQQEAQTKSTLHLRQRMAEALEGQLEASQELTEELQARLKALENRQSALMQKIAGGGLVEEYHQRQYDDVMNVEKDMAMRQRLTYQMQQERQQMQQQQQMRGTSGMNTAMNTGMSSSGINNSMHSGMHALNSMSGMAGMNTMSSGMSVGGGGGGGMHHGHNMGMGMDSGMSVGGGGSVSGGYGGGGSVSGGYGGGGSVSGGYGGGGYTHSSGMQSRSHAHGTASPDRMLAHEMESMNMGMGMPSHNNNGYNHRSLNHAGSFGSACGGSVSSMHIAGGGGSVSGMMPHSQNIMREREPAEPMMIPPSYLSGGNNSGAGMSMRSPSSGSRYGSSSHPNSNSNTKNNKYGMNSHHYATHEMAAKERAMLMQATQRQNNSTYDDANAAINSLRNLGM